MNIFLRFLCDLVNYEYLKDKKMQFFFPLEPVLSLKEIEEKNHGYLHLFLDLDNFMVPGIPYTGIL